MYKKKKKHRPADQCLFLFHSNIMPAYLTGIQISE